MALTLTPIATDNFHRADAPTLGANWMVDTVGDPSLTILSDQCVPDATDLFGVNYYSGSATPDNQYGSITLGADASGAGLQLSIRASTDFNNGYALIVIGPISSPNSAEVIVAISVDGDFNTYSYDQFLTVNVGDIFTLAAVGSTIYLLQNGVQLFQMTDTTYTSGVCILSQYASNAQTDVIVTKFVMGSASSGGEPSLNSPLAALAGYGTDISSGAEFTTNPAGEFKSPSTAIIGTNRGSRFIG